MWLKIIGSAIGSFFASLFGSWFHDRSIRKAEDEKVEADQAATELHYQTQAKEIRDEVQALPATGADSAAAQLHAEFSRD